MRIHKLRGVADGSVNPLLCHVVFEEGEVVRKWGIRNRRFNSPIITPSTASSAPDPEAVRVGADSKSPFY